jgi:hypothetical protein
VSVNSFTSSSEPRRQAARHLGWLAGGIALLLACVGGINILVDPYRVFGTPDIAGFNAVKPDFVEHLRLTTPYAIERLRPEALILGTSRVGRGLSPSHPAFKGLRTYNAALPAVSLYEVWRTLQHANAVKPLKLVVLGLDNRMFYAKPDGQGTFSEDRMAVDASGVRQRNPFAARLPDYAASLLSTDALLSSARAVRYQGWASLTLAPNGQWTATGDESDAYNGFRVMTLNTFDRYRRYSSGRFDMSLAASPLREILRLCHREDIDLRIFIPPSHVWHWEAMRLMGMTARFDQIRHEIVRLNTEVATEYGRAPFPLIDFSGYSGPNVEAAPAEEGARHPWYWETVHFASELGDRVLKRLFCAAGEVHSEFGVELNDKTAYSRLDNWHHARESYLATHTEEIAEVERMFKKWKRSLRDNSPKKKHILGVE